MSVHILSAGLLTSVQALGRSGYRHLGVGVAGAVDAYSARVANLLVGNPADAALLEITLQGPRLRFERAVRVAITGADIEVQCNGVALPAWRPVDVPTGTELAFGNCRRGARAYLAVAGGVLVPTMLGSASTDLRGGFGGMRGRPLATGDRLPFGRSPLPALDHLAIAHWWIDPAQDLDFSQPARIRVLTGNDTLSNPDALLAEPFRISADSNRQGLRLEGAPLQLHDNRERVSEPITPGTVQLPPEGQPIILLADAQTVGGYPRIGHIISADHARLAQLRPGDSVSFVAVDQAQARQLACAQRQRLARIALAIADRSRPR